MKSKIEVPKTVSIVADGAIAHPDIGEGRIIPVLIIDCSENQQFCELVLIHESTPPGDVIAKWGRNLFGIKYAYLTLEFQSPVRNNLRIRFSLEKQAGLVAGIIKARGVYLLPSQFGQKVSEGMDKPKILVEVSPAATFPGWDKLHYDAIFRRYKKSGAPRSKAKELTLAHLARVNELWSVRRR